MIIDCDSHLMPRDVFDYMGAEFASRAPRLQFDSEGRFCDIEFNNPAHIPGTTPLPVPHATHGLNYRGNTDIEARLADYERMGVDAHFALPQLTGWFSYALDPAFGTAMAHSWNLSLLKLMRQYPKQILGCALVALQDVPNAIRELEWAVKEGFPSIMLDFVYPVLEHPYGTTLASHPELWKFFERVEVLRVPVFLHAIQHGHRIINHSRFSMHGLDLLAPSDAQLNLVSLITSGLLDDFPGLQFIHAETGVAYVKELAELMDRRFEHIPIRFDEEGFTAVSRRKESDLSFKEMKMLPSTFMKERNKRQPSYYFRANFYWTIETEEPELPEAIEFIGADRFLFATDYPHNDPGGRMKFKDVQLLREHKHITEQAKEAIRQANARKLFGSRI